MSDALTCRKFHWMERPALAALLAVAAALRVIGLGDEPLWFDEGHTVAFISLPWASLARLLAHYTVHPPLYFVLLKAWAFFGGGEAWLRLPSVLCGVLATWIVWSLVREHWGALPACAAAALFATSDSLIWYSQEARMYGLVLALSALSVKMFLKFLSKPSGPGMAPNPHSGSRFGPPSMPVSALFVAATGAMLYSHNLTLFLWCAQMLIMLAFGMVGRTARRWVGCFARWWCCQAAVAVVYLPWIIALCAGRTPLDAHISWIAKPDTGTLVWLFRYFLVFESEGASTLLWAPIVVAAAVNVLLMRRDARVWAMAGCVVIPIAVEYVFSIVAVPILLFRNVLCAAPPLYALLGLIVGAPAGGGAERPGLRAARYGLGAGLMVPLIALNVHAWLGRQGGCIKEDFRGAARAASALIDRGAVVVFPNAGTQPSFDYYFHRYPRHERVGEIALPGPYLGVADGRYRFEAPVTGESVRGMEDGLARRTTAIVVLSHERGTDPAGLVRGFFAAHWTLKNTVPLRGMTLLVYVR